MSVISRCRALQESLVAIAGLQKAYADAGAFHAREARIKEYRNQLEVVLSRLEVLRRHDISCGQLPSTKPALALLATCRTGLVPPSASQGRDFGNLLRSLTKITEQLTESADNAIRQLIAELPKIDEPFLKQVELVPAYAEQVKSIRERREALRVAASRGVASPEDLQRLLDAAAALRKEIDTLDAGELPKPVLDFYKAARQRGGAPFDALTEEVRTWLAERGQLSTVRLVVRED